MSVLLWGPSVSECPDSACVHSSANSPLAACGVPGSSAGQWVPVDKTPPGDSCLLVKKDSTQTNAGAMQRFQSHVLESDSGLL